MTTEPEPPKCPVCGRAMTAHHRIMPPTMSGRMQVLQWRWVCGQSDGRNNSHHVEIARRVEE